MTSENDFDTTNGVSCKDEGKASTEQQSSATINDVENDETPADVSFELRLVVDEDKNTSLESEKEKIIDASATEDEEMDTQPLFERPVLLEGKRSRKPTLRLELAKLTPTKKELTIPQGHGKSLGEIEYINYQISHASSETLSRMRVICFGRRGNSTNIRKHLREFNGFAFERESDEYQRQIGTLAKLKKEQLRSILRLLGLTSTGRNTEQAERILNFLMKPTDEGKAISKKKSTGRKKKSATKEPKNENGITASKLKRDDEDAAIESKEKPVNVNDANAKDFDPIENGQTVKVGN
ncbi:unnamed protein product [Adineta ricciae]|uniref:SAP domain-containing protein n=1 Tax=Adineta ricciae TaxID=249248 RepID=A0A813XS75_ADIRI|nr:unnamed protein product [Adineta ricciae]CAF0872187.1 unnamed protein product [Adineta ricciae]